MALTVYFSVPITRRKSYHFVADEQGEIIFNTMDAGELIVWLAQSAEHDFLCDAGGNVYHLGVYPPPQPPEKSNGETDSPPAFDGRQGRDRADHGNE